MLGETFFKKISFVDVTELGEMSVKCKNKKQTPTKQKPKVKNP